MKLSEVNFTEINPIITAETVKQFIIHRKAKKAPLTQRALELTCKTAMKCKEEFNLDPNEAILYGIERGWQSINVKWMERDFSKAPAVTGTRTPQRMSPRQQYIHDLTGTIEEIENATAGKNNINAGRCKDLTVVPPDSLS